MWSASYGMRSASVSAMRSSSASSASSESTSWNTSARRRYDSTRASGRPAPFDSTAWARGVPATAPRRIISGYIGVARVRLEARTGVGSGSDETAGAGGVRPRPEPAARTVRARGSSELGPDGPAVGGPEPGEVTPAVARLERHVHLQPPVVPVSGVRVPCRLVVVDAEERVAQPAGHDRMPEAVARDLQRGLRAPPLPQSQQRPAAAVRACETTVDVAGVDLPQRDREPTAVSGARRPRRAQPRRARQSQREAAVQRGERLTARDVRAPRPAIDRPAQVRAVRRPAL